MKIFLKILTFLLISFNLSSAFAGSIHHFNVEFQKKTASDQESLDLTITAVDSNNEVIKDYTWNVFAFSSTDDSIELPEELASDDWYSFKLSDEWVKKFENWVKFFTSGEQTLSVYDTDDYENVTWEWEIIIISNWTSTEQIEIEILTPETNTTLAENKVKVSGTTRKNHQIKLSINNNEDIRTTSNSDWLFEKEITSLKTWDNTIVAYILDADDNILWESNSVIVRIDDNLPKFKKIILSPLSSSWTVEEGTNVDVQVFATKELRVVKILFNEWVINLSETESWIYTWTFKAPSKAKEYIIDVILSDDMWHTVTEKEAAKILVFLVTKNAAETEATEATDECSIDWKWLKIDWLKLVKFKTKSVLTWNKIEEAKSYDIFQKEEETWELTFIKNVSDPIFEIEIVWDEVKYQYFTVQAKRNWCGSWELIIWDMSDATKVQTWPTALLLILLISLLVSFWFILYKRKAI